MPLSKPQPRQLIAGNWKMNGSRSEAEAFVVALSLGVEELECDLLVCPPFTLIGVMVARLAGTVVAVGGQDSHAAPKGAFTGDIAADMLADLGARFVILGHSERRQLHGETDALVAAKAVAARAAGLTPIICVGETEAERRENLVHDIIGAQLAGSLPEDFGGAIAYEPIWAIGTGRVPTDEEVVAVHAFIRAQLVARFGPPGTTIRILYGGSVTARNAAALLALPEVSGALVGGASLNAESFLAIARCASGG